MLLKRHLKFYKSSLNFNISRTTYKEFLGVQESAFVAFGGLFFRVIDPLYFGGP
jgi:hypothetical protein